MRSRTMRLLLLGTDVEDLTEPGAEVILEPGDVIYYEDDVVHTARGADDEPAGVMGTLILTSGEQLIMPAEMDYGNGGHARAVAGRLSAEGSP